MDKIEEALSEILKKEEIRIKSKKLIYISHPYGGKEENKLKIEGIIKELSRQYPKYVFASPIHCFGFQYNDVDYDTGLSWCLVLLDACDEMWVYGDHLNSKGCTAEIQHCLDTHKQFYIK